jgi:hypothetical protein
VWPVARRQIGATLQHHHCVIRDRRGQPARTSSACESPEQAAEQRHPRVSLRDRG